MDLVLARLVGRPASGAAIFVLAIQMLGAGWLMGTLILLAADVPIFHWRFWMGFFLGALVPIFVRSVDATPTENRRRVFARHTELDREILPHALEQARHHDGERRSWLGILLLALIATAQATRWVLDQEPSPLVVSVALLGLAFPILGITARTIAAWAAASHATETLRDTIDSLARGRHRVATLRQPGAGSGIHRLGTGAIELSLIWLLAALIILTIATFVVLLIQAR